MSEFFCPVFPNIQKSIASFEGCQALPVCCFDKSSTKMKMSMGHWWKDTDKKNLKTQRKTCPSANFVHHKSHIDWAKIKPGFLW
jgi:hypothetical protein